MSGKLIVFTHGGTEKYLRPNYDLKVEAETETEFLDRIAAQGVPASATSIERVDASAYPERIGPVRAAKRAAIDAQYGGRIAAGFTHGGHVYQIDEASQTRIEAMGSLALRYKTTVGWDEDGWTTLWADAGGFKFISAGNVLVAMTAQQTFEFAQACGVYVARLRYRYRNLKTLLAIAGTVSAVNSIDETAGWP